MRQSAWWVELIFLTDGEMKAAFVTGGGGYVGRLLVRQLAEHGYSVTAFDLRFQETANEQQSGVTNWYEVHAWMAN